MILLEIILKLLMYIIGIVIIIPMLLYFYSYAIMTGFLAAFKKDLTKNPKSKK